MRRKHFDNQDYLPYEHEFIKLCKKNKLRVRMDSDDLPILLPQSKKKAKLYKIGCFGNKKFDLVITATHGKTKDKIIDIVNKIDINYTIHVESEIEAILVFDWKDLFLVAKALKLTKKNNPGNVANFQKKFGDTK